MELYSYAWRVLVEANFSHSPAWFLNTSLHGFPSSAFNSLFPQAKAESCSAWAMKSGVSMSGLFLDLLQAWLCKGISVWCLSVSASPGQRRHHPMAISKQKPGATAGGSWTPLKALLSHPGQGHLLPMRYLPFSQPPEISTAVEAVALGHGNIWYALHAVGISVRCSSWKLLSCHLQNYLLCFYAFVK